MNQELVTETPYEVVAGTIVAARNMTAFEKYFRITLPGGKDLGHQPGQFVMISIPGAGEAPISVSSSSTRKGFFELVVRKAGVVTGALHALEAGATVGIRGPYGRGFPCAAMESYDLVLIGGGCGNIPLRSLIQYVMDRRAAFGKLSLLVGCKSPDMMLFTDELAEWGARPDVSLEQTVDRSADGWGGKVGLITKLIPPLAIDPRKTFAVVVGPPVMYKFVIQELLKKDIPPARIILSLERHMKCGVGKCGHCQIGGLYCCQDGPVFTYEEIRSNREAI